MEPAAQPPGEGSITLDPRTPDEPTITVRRPPGWEFMPGNDETLIRGVLYNQELRRHGFTPNAVVTCEELTGQVGLPSQALAKERTAVARSSANSTATSPERCRALPAEPSATTCRAAPRPV